MAIPTNVDKSILHQSSSRMVTGLGICPGGYQNEAVLAMMVGCRRFLGKRACGSWWVIDDGNGGWVGGKGVVRQYSYSGCSLTIDG